VHLEIGYFTFDMPSPSLKSRKLKKNSCAKSILLVKQCKFHLNEKHLIYSAAISIKFNLPNILKSVSLSHLQYFSDKKSEKMVPNYPWKIFTWCVTKVSFHCVDR
jgi:hypothetical protein